MDAVRTVVGTAVALRRSDVDTDQIIPSVWLKRVERTGFGAGLFSQWREDPTFVLNSERHRGATILVAGPNFGTGSSREHAVWALTDYGFRVVISSRFADIFQTNCTKSGLVPVTVGEEIVARLMEAVEADPATSVTVDLESLRLSAPAAAVEVGFEMDAFTRMRFMEGLDDVGLTLRHEEAIDAFEASRPLWMPVTA
ncbi:MAG: 3-isopropylmalate dehydratase small subunit [Acidimicrobiales bacterium]